MNGIYRFISTFLFVGYFPKIPGTIASLVALAIWWSIPGLNALKQLFIITLVTVIGIITSNKTAKYLSIKDPSIIVIDEVVGMWWSLFLIPKTIPFFIFAFILFRVLDIWKPLWINTSQQLPGGLGIMVDDVLAGIITCIILHVVFII